MLKEFKISKWFLILIISFFVFTVNVKAKWCSGNEMDCTLNVQGGIKGSQHKLLDWNNGLWCGPDKDNCRYYGGVKLEYFGDYRDESGEYTTGNKYLNESDYSNNSHNDTGLEGKYRVFAYSAQFTNPSASYEKEEDSWFQAFCLDPHKSFTAGEMQYYDELSVNDEYEKGLIAIGQYNVSQNNVDYFATMIALRSWKAYKMQENPDKKNTSYHAYRNTGEAILNGTYSREWYEGLDEKNGLYLTIAGDEINEDRLNQAVEMVKKAQEGEIWYPHYDTDKKSVIRNDDNSFKLDIQFTINTTKLGTHNLEEVKRNLGGTVTYTQDVIGNNTVVRIYGTTKAHPDNLYIKIRQKDERTPNNFRVYDWQNTNYQQMFAIVQGEYDLVNEQISFYSQPGETENTGVCDIVVSDRVCTDGKDEDTSDTTYTFTIGNKNITACVLEQVDTTKSTSDNITYQQKKLKYCQIACAENFKITMPTRKYALAGTYFEFYNNDRETLEINSNRICSSRVDYNKFYTDMFNNNGLESSKASILNYNFGNRAIQDKDDFTVVTDGSLYEGGLDQQVRDYEQLVEYFSYFSNSGNYSYSDGSCKDWCIPNNRTCCEYYGVYSATQGGKTVACTTRDDINCSPSNLAASYNNKLEKAKSALEKAKSVRQSIIDSINSCTDDVKNDILKDNATIEYSYEEPYYLKNFVEDTSYRQSDSGDLYCNDLNYNSVQNSFSCNGEANPNKQEINDIYDCTDDGCKIYKVNYRAKTNSSIKKYTSSTNFYTTPGTGVASTVANDMSKFLGNVMPVALNTKGGENGEYKDYSYVFNIDGLGEYLRDDFSYTCYYNVKNDVTSPSKPEFFFRNVSLNNFDPNDRKTNGEMGKNWTSTKGRRTQCEIEGKVWDEVNDTCKEDARLNNPEKIYEEPEYSFTLTPENIANIKRYNDVYDFGNFRMRKVGSSVLDENGYDLSEGLWYTSDFIRVSTECSNCFTVNNDIENKVTWTKWTEEVEKLSGTGPAWK